MVTGAAAHLVHGIDVQRVREAIVAAEQRTSGEVRVAVARFYFWGSVTRAAARAFTRLRMTHTRGRNGVLIFVAPWRRRFAVHADVGIHQKVSPALWDQIAGAMAQDFRRGDPTAGLVRAVDVIGRALATQFPPDAEASNELPDDVALPGAGG